MSEERFRAAKQRSKRRNRWRKYGANPDAFEPLIDLNPECPICFAHIANRVDHDHAKRIPRGILCDRCNKLLGFARDSAQILENAARYLRLARQASLREKFAIVIGPCPDLPEEWAASGYIVVALPPIRNRTNEWPSSLTSKLDRRLPMLDLSDEPDPVDPSSQDGQDAKRGVP